jgi:uncharacterized membrane protein YuzA (DUF378 family)
MKKLDLFAGALVIIGALNWGLAGAFHLDLVAAVFSMRFGETSALRAAVYSLVGMAGLYQALAWKLTQRRFKWLGISLVYLTTARSRFRHSSLDNLENF